MKVLKNVRAIVLLILTLLSLLTLLFSAVVSGLGVVVTSVDANAECSGVAIGSVITHVNGGDVFTLEDFQNSIKLAKADDYVSMIIDGSPGGCVAITDGGVGLDVSTVKSNYLKMSPEIQGSNKHFYRLKGNFTEKGLINTRLVLEQRVDVLNLQYTNVEHADDRIAVTSGLYENVDDLIAPCYLTGRIVTTLNLQDGKGKLKIGNNSYDVLFYGNNVELNGSVFQENQTIFFNNSELQFSNVTNTSAVEIVYFLNSSDVISVFGFGGTLYDPASNSFYFNIPIVASERSIDMLKNVARNLGTVFSGDQAVLNGNTEYYLDGVLLSDLPMPSNLATQPIESFAIIGIGMDENYIDGLNKKTLMCLNSQPLDINLEKVETLSIEPVYEKLFYIAISIAVVVPIVISSIIFLRERRVKEFKLLLLVLTQMPIVFGAAMFTQLVFPVGWVVDLYTGFGLLASVIVFHSSIRFDKFISTIKGLKYLDWVVFVIVFITLFTPLKGFGMSLLVGLFLKAIIYNPLFKSLV